MRRPERLQEVDLARGEVVDVVRRCSLAPLMRARISIALTGTGALFTAVPVTTKTSASPCTR